MQLRSHVARAGWMVRETLWPRRCAGCGFRGTWVCTRCLDQTPLWEPPWCGRCGVPVALGCRCHQLPATIACARAAGRYAGWLDMAIQQMKYHGEFARAAHLGAILVPAARSLSSPDLVVPVPLHPRRWSERGFNQSALLAHALAAEMGWRVDETVVLRVRETEPQAGLRGDERRLNMWGAFAVQPNSLPQGAHVLVVDDVMTTGSTVENLADVLLQAGASSVDVLTVARALS